jgi:hypothetical protein
LHLESAVLEVREMNLGVLRQANLVRDIELNFSARTGTGLKGISHHHRRILGSGNIIARVTTAHRNITIKETDTGNASRSRRRPLLLVRAVSSAASRLRVPLRISLLRWIALRSNLPAHWKYRDQDRRN